MNTHQSLLSTQALTNDVTQFFGGSLNGNKLNVIVEKTMTLYSSATGGFLAHTKTLNFQDFGLRGSPTSKPQNHMHQFALELFTGQCRIWLNFLRLFLIVKIYFL